MQMEIYASFAAFWFLGRSVAVKIPTGKLKLQMTDLITATSPPLFLWGKKIKIANDTCVSAGSSQKE